MIIEDSKRPHGQAVKTSPSHGGIWGSIPHGGTNVNPNRTHRLGFSFTFPWGIVRLHARNFVARTPNTEPAFSL